MDGSATIKAPIASTILTLRLSFKKERTNLAVVEVQPSIQINRNLHREFSWLCTKIRNIFPFTVNSPFWMG
jgi:hypothetical protein